MRGSQIMEVGSPRLHRERNFSPHMGFVLFVVLCKLACSRRLFEVLVKHKPWFRSHSSMHTGSPLIFNASMCITDCSHSVQEVSG